MNNSWRHRERGFKLAKIKAGQFVILFCDGHVLLIWLKTQFPSVYGGFEPPLNPPSPFTSDQANTRYLSEKAKRYCKLLNVYFLVKNMKCSGFLRYRLYDEAHWGTHRFQHNILRLFIIITLSTLIRNMEGRSETRDRRSNRNVDSLQVWLFHFCVS